MRLSFSSLQLNQQRQQPSFCNGINGKIENGLVWELRKCDMWSTVIRAYRVKTLNTERARLFSCGPAIIIMGFLPLLPPHDEKVLLFHCFKKRRERRDQHQLMKGSSLKSAAAAKKASFHLSAAPSLSHFLSSLRFSSSRWLKLLETYNGTHIENSLGGV